MSQRGEFTKDSHVQAARVAVKEDGYLLIEDGYDAGDCREIVQWMDEHVPVEGDEVNYGGSELRIWHAHQKGSRLKDFLASCDQFLSDMEQTDRSAYNLLAIRNRALSPEDARSRVGRWHLDSFRRQYKIFLFLDDVTTDSGPLEFIPGTHRPVFKARGLAAGQYLRPSDFVKGKRTYQSIDEGWIDKLSTRGYEPTPVVCKGGTVLIIDTSAIHRARPCLAGTRYALTAYYH